MYFVRWQKERKGLQMLSSNGEQWYNYRASVGVGVEVGQTADVVTQSPA